MLEAIVGSVAAFDISNSQVQKRLLKLESGGLLVSELVGRTRLYQWNPRNPLVPPFRALLAVLSGGAAAQIYTSGLNESRDLDFVACASQRELEQVLNRLGFNRQAGRHFGHPACPYTLEFPSWLRRSARSSFASGESGRLVGCEYRS